MLGPSQLGASSLCHIEAVTGAYSVPYVIEGIEQRDVWEVEFVRDEHFLSNNPVIEAERNLVNLINQWFNQSTDSILSFSTSELEDWVDFRIKVNPQPQIINDLRYSINFGVDHPQFVTRN